MTLRRRSSSAAKRMRRKQPASATGSPAVRARSSARTPATSLEDVSAPLREASPRRDVTSLEKLSAQLRKKPARERGASLAAVAKQLRDGAKPTPAERAAMTRTSDSPLDIRAISRSCADV